MNRPPVRLFEDPSAAVRLRNDLAYARDAELDGFDLGHGAEALRTAIAHDVPVTASGIRGVLLTEILIAGVIGLGLGGAVWAMRSSTVAAQPQPHAEVRAQALEPAAPHDDEIRAEPPRMAALVPADPHAPTSPSPEPASPSPEPDSPEPASEEPRPAEEPRSRPRTNERMHAASAVEPEPATDDLAVALREAELVAAARLALGNDPRRALALTDEAAREFPEGALVQEREALSIRALAQTGELDAARTRASTFLERYPRGPHAAAVRRAVGLE